MLDRGLSPPSLNNPTNTRICNPVRRTFTWEPRNGQENIVHSICFTVLVLERPTDCQSDYRCVDINVVAPDIQVYLVQRFSQCRGLVGMEV